MAFFDFQIFTKVHYHMHSDTTVINVIIRRVYMSYPACYAIYSIINFQDTL